MEKNYVKEDGISLSISVNDAGEFPLLEANEIALKFEFACITFGYEAGYYNVIICEEIYCN